MGVRSAMSWLVSCTIEGLAAYGHAIHPTFIDMGDMEEFAERQTNAKSQSGEKFTLLSNNPWLREDQRGLARRETGTLVPAAKVQGD